MGCLKVESGRNEDVLLINTDEFPIDFLALANELSDGEPITWESIENNRIANAVMSEYGDTEEKAMEAVHNECAQDWVELLNFILEATGREVSTTCTVTLDDD